MSSKSKIFSCLFFTGMVFLVAFYYAHDAYNARSVHSHNGLDKIFLMSGCLLTNFYAAVFLTSQLMKKCKIEHHWIFASGVHFIVAFLSSMIFFILETMLRVGVWRGLKDSPFVLILTIPQIMAYTVSIFAVFGIFGIPMLATVIGRNQK